VWEHYAVVFNRAASTAIIYLNGVQVASGAATKAAPTGTWRIEQNEGGGTSDTFIASLEDLRIYNRLLSPTEVLRIYETPFADLVTPRIRISRQTAAAGVTHTTTGALVADAATIAGTVAHQHAATGALVAGSATIAGTATHLTLHTSTGALAAGSATIAGTAAHQHAATGALVASAATIAGTAAHLTLHTSTGALAASAATIAGTAAHQHTTTGALVADAATISGTAAHRTLHTSTGSLTAGSATLSGTAAHEHAAIGALIAGAATVAGSATHTVPGVHAASGALVAGSATIAGTALHLGIHVTSGAIIADAALISGTAAHTGPGSNTGAGTPRGRDKRPTKRFYVDNVPFDVPLYAVSHFLSELNKGKRQEAETAIASGKKPPKPPKITVKAVTDDGTEKTAFVPYRVLPWIERQEWSDTPQFSIDELLRIQAVRQNHVDLQEDSAIIAEEAAKMQEVKRKRHIRALELLLLHG
jgi:hypothetical protein